MLRGSGGLTHSSIQDVIAALGKEGEPKERGAPTPLKEKVTSPSSPRPPSSSPTFSRYEREDYGIGKYWFTMLFQAVVLTRGPLYTAVENDLDTAMDFINGL